MQAVRRWLLRIAQPLSDYEPDVPVGTVSQQVSSDTPPLVKDLAALASWAMAESEAATLGEAIKEAASRTVDVPEWVAVSTVRLTDIAGRPAHPYVVVDRWVNALDSRSQLVFWRRVSGYQKKCTLQEIADEIGISRERVRQIEGRLRRQLGSFLRSDEALALHWRAASLRHALGIAGRKVQVESLLVAPAGSKDYRNIILDIAGPYVDDRGWLVLRSALDTDPTTAISEASDEFGRIDRGSASEQLSAWGLNESLHEDWLTRRGEIRVFLGTLVRWGSSIGDRMAFGLTDLGRAATMDELMRHVGETRARASVVNAMSFDPRLVRVSRTHWALESWNLPQYSGVAYSIKGLLEEVGGRMTSNELVDRAFETFGISETTTRAYFYCPMFVLEGDSLHIRTDADSPFSVI